MKMDVRGFKKVSSDGKCTVLKSEDGHEIRIAHSALSAKMLKQLEKLPGIARMAEGGEVEDPALNEMANAPDPAVTPEPSRAPASAGAWDGMRDAYSQAFSAPPSAPVEPEMSQEDKDLAYYRANAGKSPTYAKMAADLEAKRAGRETQSLAPPEEAAPPTLAPDAQAGLAPQMPQAPQAPAAPAGLAGGASTQGALNQYLKGVKMEADATAKLGQETAKLHAEQAQAIEQGLAEYQKKAQEFEQDLAHLTEDFKTQHIKPNHYLENMSAGQKVQSAIGMILSGFGSGLSGQENFAVKFLNDQIARDVAAQEKNMGKTENLMKFNLQRFNNLNDARQMTLAMQKTIYAEKLSQAAALATDPAARARAEQQAALMKFQAAQLAQKTAASQAGQAILKDPNAAPLTKIQALPKGMQDDALKEYKEYRTIQANLSQVDEILDKAFDATKLGNNLTAPFESKKQRDVAYANLFPIVKSIVGEKMTDNDAKTLIDPYLSGFTTSKKSKNELKRDLKNKLIVAAQGRTPMLYDYGIVPKMKPIATDSARLMAWANANPKDKRAQEIKKRLGGK